MEQWSDPDPGSGIKHPGSATLDLTQDVSLSTNMYILFDRFDIF
jgi:hypothetical protein